jgi:hypothetical protein
MPPRRARTIEEELAQAAREGAAAVGETFVDRGFDFFERMMAGQVAGQNVRSMQALPAGYLNQPFVCAPCQRRFPTAAYMEQVHPSNGYGTCKGCYKDMWDLSVSRIRKIAQAKAEEAAKAAEARARRPGGSATQPTGSARRRPWEVLGISIDATEEEIKKAYKKLALECHPDMVPPGSPPEEKEIARARFEEIGRAKDAMLSVRKAAV